MKLAYFSTLPQRSQTGGADAINYHTYQQLQKYYQCDYFHINPPDPFISKWKSKIDRKILKVPGEFYHFSEKRLIRTAQLVKTCIIDHDFAFFRGFTSWINCSPDIPYFTYNDVNFQTFFENTFSYNKFKEKDLNRIFGKESQWLSHAKAVLYESEWGLQKCKGQYQQHRDNSHALGRAGHIPIPDRDGYEGGHNLLMIAKRFHQKGGDIAFEAFERLYGENRDIHFHIVGGEPDRRILRHPSVTYHGCLRKEIPEEMSKLARILSQAFLLIHLAREDTNPLVITEAGYYGCPTISLKKFAIPELIMDNETGKLISEPVSPQKIYQAIKEIRDNPSRYLSLRKKTMEFNRKFAWDGIGEQLRHIIKGSST